MRATEPLEISPLQNEEITVNNNQRGIWLNKSEIVNWKGEGGVRLTDYPIYNDPNPEIVLKSNGARIEYIQNMSIKYLRPSTPPSTGDIIINEEKNFATSEAPPIIIRQMAPRVQTPMNMIYREQPPIAPEFIQKKVLVFLIIQMKLS